MKETKQKESSEETIVVLDFTDGTVHIFKGVFDDAESFLYANGWNIDNCQWMVNPKEIHIEL